jgi:hypothetical protein
LEGGMVVKAKLAPDFLRPKPRATGSGLRHGMIEKSEELRLATEAGAFLGWSDDHGEAQGKALVQCPAWRKHTGGNKDTDASLYVGDKGGVRFTCYHGSCKDDVPTTVAFMAECRRVIAEKAPAEEGESEIPEGFRFFPISQLARTSLDEWLWTGFIAPALVTILHSEPKVGKTTLLTDLYRAFGTGQDFCGLAVEKCKVFVITEEGTDNWVDRRDEKDLKDHIHVCTQPPVGHADWAGWTALMEWTRKQAVAAGARCAVFDTSSGLWPVVSEYDNSEIQRALKATQVLTQAGIAVVFSSHSRKAAGSQITALRGGSALAGAGDLVVQMKKLDDEPDGVRRVLIPSGRRSETPAKLVVAYGVDGYDVTSILQSLDVQGKINFLRSVLPYEPDGISKSKLKEASRGKLSHKVLDRLLDRLASSGEVVKLHDGKWDTWARVAI